MAATTIDRRVVHVTVSNAEIATLLGQKAKEAGLIDFDPDAVDAINNGTDWEIIFLKDTTAPAPP